MSFKWQLVGLCFSLFIPALAFVGILLWQYSTSERARVEAEAQSLSRGLAVAIDREVNGVLTTVQALATSPSLQSGNLQEFYNQASEVSRLQGVYFSLRDLQGRTLLATRAPFGAPVSSPAALQDIDREVLRTNKATVSGIFTGAVTLQPAFQIVAAPVLVSGTPTYLLAASLDANSVAETLRRERLPDGWVGAAVDRTNKFVARTEDQDDYAGKPASEFFRTHAQGDSGAYYGANTANQEVLAGYAHSALTGWTTSANLSRERVEAPLRQSLLLLVTIGTILAAAATVAAGIIGRPVQAAVEQLRNVARSLGTSPHVPPIKTAVKELNEVGATLSEAAAEIAERIAERERDAAALRESAEELRDSEARLQQIMASASDYGIMTADLSGAIQDWNTGARNILGWEKAEIIGRSLATIFTPEDQQDGAPEKEMGVALAQGRAPDERWHMRKDGSRFFAVGTLLCLRTSSGEIVGFLKILRDRTEHERDAEIIRDLNASLELRVAERTRDLEAANSRLVSEATARELAEEQLRQAQKMEAIGRLTGGVAHDFNNLLTIITGSIDMLRRRVDTSGESGARIQKLLDHASEGANRAAALAYRLLAFARQHPLAPEPIDTNKLVAGMSDLLRRTLGEDIAVETVLAGGLWRTHADPNQLENALLNLAVNARDAMPDGGKLSIETANAHLDEQYAANRSDVTPGQYVMIAVGDTGSGMTPETVAKAFDPFFTTKPVGKGTGLGLSQVYGFGKQSGGHVAIYSEIGHGTTIKLYLPRSRQVGEEVVTHWPTAVIKPAANYPKSTAGETILVVEDEPMVREFSVSALQEAGYTALAAEDGPSGLALLDAHPEIVLLFTDVVLTGPMNGRKVADEALKRRPLLKVLFTTGYTRNAIIHHGRLDEGVQLIVKPFNAINLALKIQDLLRADEHAGTR